MPIPFRVAMLAATFVPSFALAQPPSQLMTLEDILRRALQATPLTAVASARTDALLAARAAASLRPQPSLEVLTENFGPPGRELYDQFQVTGTYAQEIERGGKRAARVDLVDRAIDVARAQAVVERLDYIAIVQRLYVEVQASEARIAVARERLGIARDLAREVSRRVAAARDPVFARSRAMTGIADAEVEMELAEHARDAAMTRLAALWQGTSDTLLIASGDFLRMDVPAGPYLPADADNIVLEAQGARAEAAVSSERTKAVRNPTLLAGPRYVVTGGVGFVAGLSVPLGGRRFAQARIDEAQAERRRVEADAALQRFDRTRAIALAEKEVGETRHEAEAIRDKVVPRALKTLEEVRFGYNRGFFSLADVTAAQTTLADARARVVDAAHRHHDARVQLDRLTGRFTHLAVEAQ